MATPEEFDARLGGFKPDLVVLETKTPVVKRHWAWIDAHPGYRTILVGDHVTALPGESMDACRVEAILTGGDWDFLLLNYIDADGDVATRHALNKALKEMLP